MRTNALAAALTAVLLLGAAPGDSTAASRVTGDAIVISGRVDVTAGERAGTIVVAHGDVDVRRSAEVSGDVVVGDGDVRIAGKVEGDVVTFGGRALIASGGEVGGDVRYGDERPSVARGARVAGDVSRLSADLGGAAPFIAALALWLAMTVSTLVLGLVLLWLAPRAADRVFGRMRDGGWGPASGVGLAIMVGLPVVALAALLTVVALPFGIVVLAALLPLAAIGYVTAAWVIGRALAVPPRRRVVSFLAGWAILRGIALIPFFGVIVFLAAAMFGLGALAYTAWGHRHGPPSADAVPRPAAAPAG